MTGCGLIAVVGASLLLLQVGGVLADETATEKQHTGRRVDCLGPMNAARTKVGLAGFQAAPEGNGRLPIIEAQTGQTTKSQGTDGTLEEPLPEEGNTTTQGAEETFLTSFCLALSQTTASNTGQTSKSGTYMYAPANSDAESSCTSAVNYWLEAQGNITTLPPPYSDSQQLYKDHRNISFVGLYNASSDVNVDCAFITCNYKVESEVSDSPPGPDPGKPPNGDQNASSPGLDGEGGPEKESIEEEEEVEGVKQPEAEQEHPVPGSRRRLSATYNSVNALLCLTTPQALKDSEQPFTQDQWNKIKGIENRSNYPTALAVFTLVAAVLVPSLF